MRPEIERLKSHLDARSISSDSLYHTSQEEAKLHHYNKCVDQAQKYRLLELNRAKHEFRRKYSWYLEDGKSDNFLTRRSLPVARDLSENKYLGKHSNSRRVSFKGHSQEKTSSQESEPDGCKHNPTGTSNSIQSQPDTGITTTTHAPCPAIRLSTLPSHAYRRHSSRVSTLTGRERSTLNMMRRPVRNSMSCPSTGRKPSNISTYSNDRLSQLETLWDRVFKSHVQEDSHSGQNTRKQELTAREKFTGIVLQQFNIEAGNAKQDVARRPLKGKGRNPEVPWHSTPRTSTHTGSTLHEPAIRISGCGNEDGNKNGWTPNAFNFVKNKNGSEGDCHNRRGSEAESMQRKENSIKIYRDGEEKQGNHSENIEMYPETKTLHINESFSDSSMVAPNDGSITSFRKGGLFGIERQKYSSLYNKWIRSLWQICFLGILATRSGRPSLYKYALLRFRKEKTDVLKRRLWEIDMRRCRYLRIRKPRKDKTKAI